MRGGIIPDIYYIYEGMANVGSVRVGLRVHVYLTWLYSISRPFFVFNNFPLRTSSSIFRSACLSLISNDASMKFLSAAFVIVV